MEKNKKSNEFNFYLKEAYTPPIKTEIVEEITIGEELTQALRILLPCQWE